MLIIGYGTLDLLRRFNDGFDGCTGPLDRTALLRPDLTRLTNAGSYALTFRASHCGDRPSDQQGPPVRPTTAKFNAASAGCQPKDNGIY